ncbi:MAG: citramalate synthase [Cyanobacteria bacterium 13_1_40CM_2_61_4]|nr:MAG: citramalate synthase [Cyanobacteria bacterium 13_1_40CM_2_61_4]
MTDRIEIYDTTLRDGSQGEGVNFSVADKCRVAEQLDAFGVDFIEGGWPGSNPRDLQFFERAHRLKLTQARIAAFGSTRRHTLTCDNDPSIQSLLQAQTPVVTIFGKSWLLHVQDALRLSPEENLEIIEDTVRYLAARVPYLIYDAEHFFDGYQSDPAYALASLRAAAAGGPQRIVLCDTNGGSLPETVARVTREVIQNIDVPLGIHCHNDGELAVANTLAAVSAGAIHVQGTINGYGERCGNANLCAVIPNLELKLGRVVLGPERLKRLRETSRFVSEIANLSLDSRAAFVGDSAFAHKGGVHVSAVERNPATYEHIAPETVGNRRRVLVSDLAGRANLLAKARELGVELDDEQRVLDELKRMEHDGYEFEAAEASFELLVSKLQGAQRPYFELLGFRVIDEHRGALMPMSEATVKVKVGSRVEHTAASGNGPVNALDNALRSALQRFYPSLAEMHLVDYKVRVITSNLSGTASLVRVLICSGDGRAQWGTVGVSANIVEASWRALVDSVEYKLTRDGVMPICVEQDNSSPLNEAGPKLQEAIK